MTSTATAIVEALKGSPEPIEEGVFDPYILKAVFMAGGGGSGKTFFANMMFGGLGLKFSNSDTILEKMAAALELDLRDPKVMGGPVIQHPQFGLRQRAKKLYQNQEQMWIKGRLGLIIDSTAANVNRVLLAKKKLEEDFGYDTYMVFVNTPLETSLRQNASRARRVPDDIVTADWNHVQQAKALYERTFGSDYREIQNERQFTDQEIVRQVIPMVTRMALKLVDQPIRNPKGKAWVKEHTAGLKPGTQLGVGTGKVESVGRLVTNIIETLRG